MLTSIYHLSCTVAKQPNFNWGTFTAFNIVESLWNYFACKLLSNYLSS